MTNLYCFTKRAWIVCALVAALVLPQSALSQVPQAETQSDAPAAADSPESSTPETNEETLYGVLAGEVLGADGLTSEAAFQYLEAALESENPAIAARATRIALAAQEWQVAAMAADRWALLAPDNIDARQTAARTMIAVGDYVGAEHQLGGILRAMASDSGKAWSLVAELLSTSANPEKIGQVLDNLVQDHAAEQNPDALFAGSIVAGRQGRLQESLDLAEQALAIDAGRADIHAWAGRLAVNLDLQEQALAHYRAAWELRPGDQRIVMAYAELLRRNEQSAQAQDVLASMTDTPETRFARIAFALDSGHQELAARLYREFADTEYSDKREAAFQAAQAAELLDLGNEALDWYAKIDGGPRLLVAQLRSAYLSADAGELDKARRLLTELRNVEGEDYRAESFIAESEILVDAGQAETAMALLSGAVSPDQPDTRLLYSRAMLGVQLDRLDAAEADLRRIIELEPQNATALNALGYTLADRTDRLEEAERLIQAAYQLQPEESSIIDSMGWVAFKLGRLDEAEHYLRDAWTRDRNAEIGAHLGEVLWTGERPNEARLIWQEAREVDPGNTVLVETMQRFGVEP